MYSLPCASDGYVVARLHDLVGDHLDFFADFIEAPSHEALNGVNRVFGIGDGLPLGDLAHQALAGLGERHHRRCGAPALFVGDDLGFATLHDRHDRIGSAKVDAYNLRHWKPASCWKSSYLKSLYSALITNR